MPTPWLSPLLPMAARRGGAIAAGRMKGWFSRIVQFQATFMHRSRECLLHEHFSTALHHAHRFTATNTTIATATATPPALTAAASREPVSGSNNSNDVVGSTAASITSSSPRANAKVVLSEELGVVSRLSVSRNATVASSWETVPNWCELCFEPINGWDNHVGKREHICLEMTLNAMAAHPRSWNAADVWWRTELFREHYAKRPRGQPRTPSTLVRRMIRAGMVLPAVDSPMNIFYEAFDKTEPLARREELLLLLLHLKEKGFLSLSPEYYSLATFQGSLLLHKELMPSLACMFPKSEVRGCSAMSAMITSNFNTETAYMLCGMEALVPPELLRARLSTSLSVLSKGKESEEAGGSSNSNSNGSDDDEGKLESGEEDGGGYGEELEDGNMANDGRVPLSLRCSMARAVLGSLRWALEPGSMPPPPALHEHEVRYGYFATLAARAARLLLAELVYDRVSEYVFRTEEVLRSDRGQELMRTFRTAHADGDGGGTLGTAQMRALYTRSLVPLPSNHGMLEFTSGVGLCAAKLLGNPTSNNAIQAMEEKRAMRLTRRQLGKAPSSLLRPLSRDVRHI